MTEERRVYRFVHSERSDDPLLREDFVSDRESGKRPFEREKVIPELQDGMSTFGSLTAARERWRDMEAVAATRGQPVRAGYYIAEVALRPDSGFAIEDLGEVDEHVTIWGDADALFGAIAAIYPAASPAT